MDWSLCDSKILLALYLTDSEQLTANPGAFSLSAPTQRFFSIKVCCAVAVLMFHRCVLSSISQQWPAARERGFPDSHISLAPVALSIKNHLRDTTPPTPPHLDKLDFSLHSDVICCMCSVLILTHVCAGWLSMYVFCTFSPCPKFSFLTSLSVFQFILMPLPPDFVSVRDWLVSA